ncbi:Methyltransferase domain containing protein [uncultured Caudovirales phage]|uniref:Methyltransferase domain containing protein n=1 Tax=uncultured Caudovirales phage TaxID=2100421 RepID=A0A6J5LET2_9CAUD|nr:Methyltransferase domain containing protein [uncultured Caudovirales phage]
MTVLSGAVYEYACSILPDIHGNYFEIGVFNGNGFARIAKENPTKKCYAVDPFIEDGHTVASSGVDTGLHLNQQKQNFLENTKDLTNTTLYEMTSTEFSKQLTDQLANEMNISVVTIDGDHHYEHAQIDFSIAVKLIGNRTGIIIVDDTDVSGVIRAYVEFKEQFAHRIAEEVSAGGSTQVLLIKEI